MCEQSSQSLQDTSRLRSFYCTLPKQSAHSNRWQCTWPCSMGTAHNAPQLPTRDDGAHPQRRGGKCWLPGRHHSWGHLQGFLQGLAGHVTNPLQEPITADMLSQQATAWQGLRLRLVSLPRFSKEGNSLPITNTVTAGVPGALSGQLHDHSRAAQYIASPAHSPHPT